MILMDNPSSLITPALLQAILQHYLLSLQGIHGVSHWARVLENGHRLAVESIVRMDVVELFAVFHDSRRFNNSYDPEHGQRGGELAKTLRGQFFEIDDAGMALLIEACANHTCGWTQAYPTIQVCWDSDRLDLGRVGNTPCPELLCTPAARQPEMIAWAESRARPRSLPEWVTREWGISMNGNIP